MKKLTVYDLGMILVGFGFVTVMIVDLLFGCEKDIVPVNDSNLVLGDSNLWSYEKRDSSDYAFAWDSNDYTFIEYNDANSNMRVIIDFNDTTELLEIEYINCTPLEGSRKLCKAVEKWLGN